MIKRAATNAACTSGGDALTYNAENLLTQDVSGGVTTTYAYDGDGQRVRKTISAGGTVTNTYYIGNYFEATVVGGNTTTTKYYYFGAQRIAMMQGSTVTYLYGDHLGSTSATSTDSVISKQTYYAYGAVRTTDGTLPTDYTFTGQKIDASDGLMYYGARYYDAAMGRFIQPDSIIPNQYDPQSLNRYAYVRNNPVRYTDPTGHRECGGADQESCENPGARIESPAIESQTQIPDSPNGGDPADPWQVGAEWLTGQGPRDHEFRNGDPFTELLKTHSHIQDVRKRITERVRDHDYRPGEDDYSLGGLDGVLKYVGDYSNVLSLGHTGNLAVTYLGSYNLDYSPVSADREDGSLEVLFHVSNESNLATATHPLVLGYTEFWRENIEPTVNGLTSGGPMSRTTQNFWWTETLHWK